VPSTTALMKAEDRANCSASAATSLLVVTPPLRATPASEGGAPVPAEEEVVEEAAMAVRTRPR
jgi:hypothetical protein